MFATSIARAEPSGADKAAAEALFDDARRLMKEGRFADACPKLVESQKLDAGIGTLMYLADCYERDGRVASAWATWREAAHAAHAAAQLEREQVAKARADALSPSLPHIVVVVRAATPGITVRRNGAVVAEPLWGTPIPVDPGDHVVEASAEGRVPFRRTIAVAKGERQELAVPELEVARVEAPPPAPVVAPPAPPAQPEPTPKTGLGTSRTVALGLAGAGVVAAAIGTYFGLRAASRWSDAEGMCPNDRCRDAAGNALASDARADGTVSTIAFAGSGVALAGAAVLWFVAGSSARGSSPSAQRSARILPIVSSTGGGIAIGGSL
ncbi:MAG: hypothetical protein KIT84_44315 [Labilithrix sp.]|nr:hypothetical protein [Labilithrix sp.]